MTTHHGPLRVHDHICTAKVNAAVETLCNWSARKNKDDYLCIMWNNLEESAESEGTCCPVRRPVMEVRGWVSKYLGGVWALHVRLGTVVDSSLQHLLYASHQEDIWVRACYREHSLWRRWRCYNFSMLMLICPYELIDLNMKQKTLKQGSCWASTMFFSLASSMLETAMLAGLDWNIWEGSICVPTDYTTHPLR